MPDPLSEALAYHQNGDLDRAARAYEAVLVADPNHPDALHFLGVLALQRGDPGRALALIARSVALRPDDATSLADLAEAYWGLGQVDRAIECGRAALRLEPENAAIHCNLGSNLIAQGELDSALEHLREAVRLAPDLAAARNNLGNALRVKGEKSAALMELRHAIRLDPGSAEAHSSVGELFLELDQPEAALRHCREALRLRPALVAARVSMGNTLHTLGRLDEAAACFGEAIRQQPDLAAAHAGLAGTLEELGRLDESQAALRQALRHDPHHAGALARLATRLRGDLPEADRAAIERRLGDPGLPTESRWPLLFGLGHVLDARGEFDQAAELVAEANALQRENLRRRGRGYDREAHRQFVDRLIEAFRSGSFERTRGGGLETERPVFVFGMPRSGTTLVEQVLASHPRVFGAGELNLVRESFESIPGLTGRGGSPIESVPFLTAESVGRLAHRHLEALEALDRSAKADRIVDKMPENALYLGLIAAMFPNARLIHCRRDPRDVALSCWMTHFAQVRWACDLDDIASRIGQYRRVMEHWRHVLPVPVFELDYEAVVGGLEDVARRLFDWCGLDWDPACLEFHKTRRPVRTTIVAQVRQPLYGTSVGRWRNYERALAGIFRKLDDEASMPAPITLHSRTHASAAGVGDEGRGSPPRSFDSDPEDH
jgi:tetratricopeptide (TPR) repeat protein